MKVTALATIFLGIGACATAPATDADIAPGEVVTVMVVGSYHMAGSTSDVVSIETDNVLSPQRQKELAAVASALATFRPTVIATERQTPAPDYIDPGFEAFTDAGLARIANEREQLGYRLAKLSGVARVYGIDEQPAEGEPDYFPFDALAEHAGKTGQSEKLGAMIAEAQKMGADFAASQKDKSIAELLIETNAGAMASADFYYRLFDFDRGEAQPGAELNAYWFMRNAKIFSKLRQVTEPGDRVVVIYGAGHKHWLEHLVRETPGFALADPLPLLESAAAKD